jgi:hypothetical protein
MPAWNRVVMNAALRKTLRCVMSLLRDDFFGRMDALFRSNLDIFRIEM